MRYLVSFLLLLLPALSAQADSYDSAVTAQLRPGWRLADGTHMAALHLTLAPGWKTYWRAPGDAGIPPVFDWAGSENLHNVDVRWPVPKVFWQSGMRSVGYADQVILPLRLTPKQAGGDVSIAATVDIGVCFDVCVPKRIGVRATLPSGLRKPDPVIVAALADEPLSAEQAGVTAVSCALRPAQNGMALSVEIAMPRGTGSEETVVEFHDPRVWVAEPETRWNNGMLIAETRLVPPEGGAFAVDRKGLRITVLGGRVPVDIKGCSASR